MELKEIMRTLCEPQGPAGFESAATAAAAELLRPLTDELHTDPLGNLIAWRRCGLPNAPVVMLDAHMDQIGLIVTGYEKGFLRFESLGGVDGRLLPAMEVELLTKNGPIRGVIDALPPHLLSADEAEKPIPADKLFIDAGFETEETARAAVPQGTPAAFVTPFFALGEHRVCSRSLDNRSCAAVLLAVMERTKGKPLAVDVAVHLAAQEEVGGRGALTGAWSIRPDYAIIVDVTFGHAPDCPRHRTVAMNGGAAIGVGPAAARSVSDRLQKLAEERKIPWQFEVMGGGSGTDADEIQTTREGVATGIVSLPLKYMHTPVEVVDLRDAQAMADLIVAWLESFGEE